MPSRSWPSEHKSICKQICKKTKKIRICRYAAMQTDFGGGRRKRIVKFSQRRVETGLHICISAYCLNLWFNSFWLVWKWTLRRPSGRRVSEGCTQKSRVCFEFLNFEFRNLKTHTMNFNFNINICSYWSTRIQTICADAGMQTGFSGGRRFQRWAEKRIVKFSQRRVETWLHICISAYCLN